MGINTYERPREKLQQKGVAALNNIELLQVIIGSGNAGMPVIKIARKVNKVLKQTGTGVEMADLIVISGLGTVKAGQILAGIELAIRLSYQGDVEIYKQVDVLEDLYNDIRASKQKTLLCAFFDGSGQLIEDQSQIIESEGDTVQIVRKLFADALARSTASIQVFVGSAHQALEPSMFELNLARDTYKMAAILSIPIKSFVLVSTKGEYKIKEVRNE